ncbi:hypothetical protein AnigIFM63604_005492 [Aspergillus niger]|uniref:D-xylose 1-dehydrogenase (NADP(+), D-xylono-1,5-lactone-forming) n=1 Tax=Aspergillus niger TaxID=5061 RepID=A0A9W6A056_ASPNG|nr:hypothetical protein AnigIFM63604_005492 [Aspergillus niger]
MLFFDFVKRAYYAAVSPPTPTKRDDAIRIGLLGASTIAPLAVITPAKSHPEVIVAAVAARDRERARQYAKKHSIPIVHNTYQDLLDDPAIDAVYIALPNSLHYEWALRSIQAGKHVLLEKPSCSNAEEARKLFRHPLVTGPNAPVLLEAFHYQFHPAWQAFLYHVNHLPWGATVDHVYSQQYLPKGYLNKDDIRFKYGLSGGCLMDLATYPLSCVRQVLGRGEHLNPIEAMHRPLPVASDGSQVEPQIDVAIKATYATDSDKTAEIRAGDVRAQTYQEWWTTWRCQLEEFVNRIKGRAGSGVWIDGEESIAQMEAIDETYIQAGLNARPTSAFEIATE